jgi:hypothetical protein
MKTFRDYFNRLPKDIQKLYICAQRIKHHPEIWVYTHTRMVFEQVLKLYGNDVNLLVAALFHDIAKKDCKRVYHKNGIVKTSHIGHEKRAIGYINMFIHLFDDLNIDADLITSVVENHMRAHQYTDGTLKKISKRKAFEDLRYFDDIIKFSKCDMGGRL